MSKVRENVSKGYYHCIECEALFESEVKDASSLVCPNCGKSPSAKGAFSTDYLFNDISDNEISPRSKVRREPSVKKKVKSNQTALWLSGVGVFLLLVMVFFLKQKTTEVEGDLDRKLELTEQRNKAEKIKKITSEAVLCEEVMNGFVRAKTEDSLLKFVYNNAYWRNYINKHYIENPLFVVGDPKVTLIELSYIRDREPLVFGAVFKDELGEEFESALIQEKDGYKIDWGFHTRFNSVTLKKFLNHSEEYEIDLRLYMRTLNIKDDLILVFYPPETDSENSFDGMSSSSLSIPADGETAHYIMGILDNEEPMDKDYRTAIKSRDPQGYHRVRVRLRLKIEEGKENSLELVSFIANDWYSVDITNMDLAELESGE